MFNNRIKQIAKM